jgi:hypothetical protein
MCSRIIHQASGSIGWTELQNVLLSYGVFELGICFQQTHGGLCHLVGSHSSFFKGKRVSFSLILKHLFPSNMSKGATYVFKWDLKSTMSTEIKLHVFSIDDPYCLLVCLQLWCDERKLVCQLWH